MLTDDELKRIAAEEHYRHSIRKAIEAQVPPPEPAPPPTPEKHSFGKKLFGWTEPALPEGWHGVRWMPWRGPATIMVIHR